MLNNYIQQALELASYEMIDEPEPYYGEVSALEGVWATGKSLEECRRNLIAAVEDWVLFSIAKGLPIPSLGGISIEPPRELALVGEVGVLRNLSHSQMPKPLCNA